MRKGFEESFIMFMIFHWSYFLPLTEPKNGPASRWKAAEEEGCVAPTTRSAGTQRACRAGRAAAPGCWWFVTWPATRAREWVYESRQWSRLRLGQVSTLWSHVQWRGSRETRTFVRRTTTERSSPGAKQETVIAIVFS